MLLQELTGIKSKESDFLSNALLDLQNDGKAKLKNGSFSVVIVPSNRDYVYKVWTKDSGWEHFLKVIKANQADQHFPKIVGSVRTLPFNFKRPDDFETNLNVVRIEKLKPLSVPEETAVDELVYKLRSIKQSKLEISDASDLRAILDEKYQKDIPVSFVEAVIKAIKESGTAMEDIAGNIMKREDGTFVLVDPYFTPGEMLNITTASDILRNDFGKKHSKNLKSGR